VFVPEEKQGESFLPKIIPLNEKQSKMLKVDFNASQDHFFLSKYENIE
jgi:hypothetical protein